MTEQKTEISNKYLPWLAAMALFMQSLDGTILNTSLPNIAEDMNYAPLQIQSIIVSYTLTLALFIPLSGWLSDKFGTRKIFTLALILFTLGSLFCALSQDLTQLILSRIIQAIGGSMMVPVARLSLLYAYPKNQLLKVINMMTVAGLVGPVIGPSLGGWLSDYLSWHWIFMVNIPIGLAGIILTQKVMPNFMQEVKTFDLRGLLWFSFALILITLAMELLSVGIGNSIFLIALLIISALFFYGYVLHAKRVKNPLIDLKLFSIRTLRIGLSGSLFTRLGIGGIPFLLPLMLQVGLGYSASIAGMMLLPAALTNILIKPWVVTLVKKWGYRNILISNTLSMGVLITLFSFTENDTSLIYILILMIMYGMFNSVQMTAMNTITLSDLDSETASAGNSMLAIMQQLSVTFGISAAALFLSFYKHNSNFVLGNTLNAFQYTFLTLGIVTMTSTFIFMKLKKHDGHLMSGKAVSQNNSDES